MTERGGVRSREKEREGASVRCLKEGEEEREREGESRGWREGERKGEGRNGKEGKGG